MFQPLCVIIIGLTLLLHNAKGITRQIIVEENLTYYNPYHDVWNSPNDSSNCCVTGDCICRSFFLALNNLTSNVVINITTDVLLPSLATLVNLENITILGHNSPTVIYNYNGALEFLHCKNIKIESVKWNGYFIRFHEHLMVSVTGIHFQSSSSISFSLCTFQHFVGQVIKLMNVSEYTNISGCEFINNIYRGDGTAIYVSKRPLQMLLNINETYFGINGPANSIVYLHGHQRQISAYKHILISNSRFSFNRATPLFLIDETIHVSGNILFEENLAPSGAAISSISSNIIFDENCIVGFYKNRAYYDGGAIYLFNHSFVSFASNTTVQFFYNTASFGGGVIFSEYYSEIIFKAQSNTSFVNNTASMGGALYSASNSSIKFENNSFVQFIHNTAEGQIRNNKGCTWSCGGAIFQGYHSIILFSAKSLALLTNNDALQSGGAIHSYNYSEVIIEGSISFISNTAQYGGALYFNFACAFKVKDNASVEFDGNVATSGGAIYGLDVFYRAILYSSSISFDQNSNVIFTKNKASRLGGAIASDIIKFSGSSIVTFTENTAHCGGAISCDSDKGDVIFQQNSTVTMHHNDAKENGAAICFTATLDLSFYLIKGNKPSLASIKFRDNVYVIFSSNHATFNGGVINCHSNCSITFQQKAIVMLTNNSAESGGAIFCELSCGISFEQFTHVLFVNNIAIGKNGGAISLLRNSTVNIEGYSVVHFLNNTAASQNSIASQSDAASRLSTYLILQAALTLIVRTDSSGGYGGAISLFDRSVMSLGKNSTVMFKDNKANSGGAISIVLNSAVTLTGNTSVLFVANTAREDGGALYSSGNDFIFSSANTIQTSVRKSKISFEQNSVVVFTNNSALNGGAVCGLFTTNISFKGNSSVSIVNNTAANGAAITVAQDCSVSFEEYSNVTIMNNRASIHGGAVYSIFSCDIVFDGDCMITFSSNEAAENGGGLYSNENSVIKFKGNYSITFFKNTAENGGAIYISATNITFKVFSLVTFHNNRALQNGGAMYIDDASYTLFEQNSTAQFVNNSANDYGGAVYSNAAKSKIIFNSQNINFTNNNAKLAGTTVYAFTDKSCDHFCLVESVQSIDSFLQMHIVTSPNKLNLSHPAIYLNNSGLTNSVTYYLNHIMLGQEITFGICILDYYDEPAGSVQLVVKDNIDQQGYYINGPSFHSITSCDIFKGIAIHGNEIPSKTPLNFSFSLLYDEPNEEKVFVNIIVELSHCHPGFWHNDESQKCSCFHTSNIVSCSGGNSTIKRGYWFGSINGRPTVAKCPINYCNFTCCEATNGYYHLSPQRINQCSFHRAGTACGSCEEDYTLSFDSPECLHIQKCTVGQTVLVVTITVLYWVVVVVLVFIIMHYRVGIGYLYAITFYYSILDLLLIQSIYISNSLYVIVNILSSVVKITPQFLGQLCFVKNMSGIDQQFLHYAHPVAISVILVIISLLARISYKFSAFISRAIIRVICCLLLLSYTSLATTSLLLLRLQQFTDISNIYTYLSPNIEYFHGRHLPYTIVAMLFTIAVVIGLPLLLFIEPFINHKINFTRIKPFLDQFQGCFKDKYRCFAAYYMIYRIVIIIIINVTTPDNFIGQYLMITTSTLMAYIHQTVRPYANSTLNIFDGLILHLTILATAFSIIENFDKFNSTFAVASAFVIVISPLMICMALVTIIHRENLKKKIANFVVSSIKEHDVTVPEIPTVNDFGMIIDDSTRTKVTICDM